MSPPADRPDRHDRHWGGDELAPLFRWSGTYWGFVQHGRIHDRHGRQFAWLEPEAGGVIDAFDLWGRFVGEWRDRHYLLRSALRPEPVPRAGRAPVPIRPVPAWPPNREPRDPLDVWVDALPWPLPPPPPPVL